jgi:SPP1 family predicted phage head-tail adaptor
MQLGDLDRPIVIEQFTGSLDAYNYQSKSWSTYISPWAKLESGPGVEGYESNELVSDQTVHYVIRYDSGVTTKMRVNVSSVYYEIVGIQYLDRDCFMRLKCKLKDSKML